ARIAASIRAPELLERVPGHGRQLRAVLETADLGLAVGARAVAHRQLHDFQILLGGPEDQIEIPERIEVAEEAARARDLFVVAPEQHLGSAQRVLEALLQDRRQREAERLVADGIEKAHRLAFERVDEARSVDELAAPLGDGSV